MKNKLNKQTKILYTLAFLIPVAIMMTIFIIHHVFPFGDQSFLHVDMYHQYFPFFMEFYHKLRNGESLFYSWNTGIGSNFVALFVYYLATPTNWLALICPEKYLLELMTYMVVIKIGLCGLSFAHYTRKHFNTDSYAILFFSVFYALSGFMAAYNWNVMWIDCIAIAPIVILGLERLVLEGNAKLYCLSLAFCIFTNYYLSIMICLFLVLYFFVTLIGKDSSSMNRKEAINFYGIAVLRFGIYSLLAGGMAGILLLPELVALKFSDFTSVNFPSSAKSYFTMIDMLARHCFNVTVETGLDHWPNVYCGVAVLLLLPLYALQKKIPLRERAPKLALLVFMLLSYSINTLNFIWHGLNYPDSLPARQSFLYIFLLLTLCFEALLHVKELDGTAFMGCFMATAFFVLFCEKSVTDDAFKSSCFLYTGLFIIFYAFCVHLYRSKGKLNIVLTIILIVVTMSEAGFNTYNTSIPTVSRDSYFANFDSYRELTSRTVEKENNDFFRIEKFARKTQNDAMLPGFQSASYFSSTINALVKEFYGKYGMKSSKVYYCYDGATAFTSALLATRYMLYTQDRGYDDLYTLDDTEGDLYLYKNLYSLPLGFMIPDEGYTDLFSNSSDVLERLHDKGYSYSDPIGNQNQLLAKMGIYNTPFTEVCYEGTAGFVNVEIPYTGHYYAYSRNTSITDIKLISGPDTKTFSSIKKKYILDLGYHEEGEIITLASDNGESLDTTVYWLNPGALNEFYFKLNQQNMIVDSYDSTNVKGHVSVERAGNLVLSVGYEPGWTLLVDGKKVDIMLFDDALISTYLEPGEHSIELKYYPAGFNLGILVSILSITIYVAICFILKRKEEGKPLPFINGRKNKN